MDDLQRKVLSDKYIKFIHIAFGHERLILAIVRYFADPFIIAVPKEVTGPSCEVNAGKDISKVFIIDEFSDMFIAKHTAPKFI